VSYESGAGDVLRLLTATREWLAARTEEYAETYRYGEHLALLERALGEPIGETKP
jgi:outer membrane protein TolC